MNQVLRVTLTAPESWRWPVDLAAHNRSEQFTSDEKRALASVAEPRRCSTAWERHFGDTLERLLRPLDEVFAITKASKAQRNGSIIILLREMHRLQTSFWAWSFPEWIGVLQPSAPLFAEQHGGADTYRSHLLAVSYLLGGLNDLSAIGYFNQSWLATRVFGKAVLDPPMKQVRDELLRKRWQVFTSLISYTKYSS